MYALIFRNWKFALLWAVGLTASAAAFIEKDGGQAKVQASADQIRAQREPVSQPAAATTRPANPVADQAEEDEESSEVDPAAKSVGPADGGEPAEPGEATDAPA